MPNNSATRASIDNTRMTRTASGVKMAYLTSSQQSQSPTSTAHSNSQTDAATNGNPPLSVNTGSSYVRPIARERPFARDDAGNVNTNSRPPSIRSATSFGRPLTRFITGHHARHHSNYSSFSTMSEIALPWTTRDIGFNAISGVLNDPAKSKDLTKPNKVDIPPVPHASIPRIKPSDFETYLHHIAPAFERYQHNKLNNKEETEVTAEEERLTKQQQQQTQSKRLSRNPYSLPQNILSSESLLDEQAATPPRDLPMLENVPAIFFEPDFYLENPQVFDTVCEGADIVGNSGPNPPVSTNSILQEKLSYYLDTVEVHLLQEIENRSSSFFEALSNLQALHQQTLDCVGQIHTIRQKMKRIQDTECKDGLEIIRLQVRKRNLEKLYRVTKAVKEIQSAQPMIQILLGKGDYFGALDLIDETKDRLKGKSIDEDVLDLSSVKALANFSSQLDEMQKAVGVMMQHDFLSILLSDLSYKIESLDSDAAKQALLRRAESTTIIEESQNEVMPKNDGWNTIDLDKEKELQERVTQSTIGLLRTDMLYTTLQGYQERLMVEVKDIIRKRYPPTPASTPSLSQSDDPGVNLAKQLKSMPFSSFFQMLLDIFSTLIEMIQRASVYHQIIMRVVEAQNIDSEFLLNFSKESADIVFSAADLAHVRCGKLIGFRSDQNALLNPTDFYRLTSVVRTFIVHCEVLCGRTCFGLRGTVMSQQKAFIEHFHMERVKQEAQLIENEQWTASEVPPDFQLIVDRICDGRISSFVDEKQQHVEGGDKTTKHLFINGHSYFIVGCSLLILKMFEDYLKCVLNLENMVPDITQKLLELLKLFNSRVCQVILGAGAMRSAGLKNITAKHLALASQSLAIMIALIPKLKECISRHIVSKQTNALPEFDRIVKDYTDHQGEIHAKLIAIMNERFATHAKSMQAVQWDEDEPQTGKNANTYMETLVTETVRLHKVLAKYLPIHDLKFIMSQVFESFTTQLSDQISHTTIKTEKGKDRLARDASYFTRRLKSLHHVDPPSNAVIEAVDNLVIPSPSSPTNETSPENSS
ncbi:MAG: Vps54-like protein-domain-containing protein [Benjaminiella poitrasii]|nr:MAG: Vps54-like protein-domain-containing protein [Benjaminiella poitrasii]